jgi:cytidylate kinase
MDSQAVGGATKDLHFADVCAIIDSTVGRRPIIAIDGTAASGKSTTAKLVAERLGYTYVDTGAMYRALTLEALRLGIDPGNGSELAAHARKITIHLVTEHGELRVRVDGRWVTDQIRSPEVDRHVSQVASHAEVRRVLVSKQRELAKGGGVVCEGRDMGTVVFSDADLKIYMDASVEERAHRRRNQLLKKGIDIPLEHVVEKLKARDTYDIGREHSPLRQAEGAVLIDTTLLSIEEQVEKVLEMVSCLA